MRRRTFGVAVLGLALLCASAALPADDILKVIPETSLVAVVTQNAEEAEKHIHAVVEKIDSSVSKESLVEAVLREFKLRPRKPTGDPGVAEPTAGTSTIDLAGPVALVLVSSSEDAPGIPVAVVVKVRNYKDLLRELAAVVGAAAPEVTADGTDLLKGQKQSLFAMSSGDYAVVADAEYVVKTFKTGAEKNLAVADFPELRKACETSDVAIYHNVDAVAKRYAADIDVYRQALQEQVKNPPKDEPLMMDPEKAARSFGVLADRVVKSWSETDAILWGLTFRDEGVTASARVRPVPESSFARLVARMKPGRPGIVEFLGGPSVASAAWSVDPELLKALLAPLDEILSKIEPTDKRNGKKSVVECLRKLTDAATGSGTYVWSPPGEEKGMVRCTALIPLKPDTDVSGIVKDLVNSSTDLLNACGGPVRTKTKFEEGVQTYRDCRIDKITDTFQQNPDAPAPLNPNVNVLRLVEAVYGTELVIYVTRAHDVLVCTIGYPATDTLKAQVDRVLDNKHGDLVGSADYQHALKGLPAERCVESVFSLATLLRFASAEDSLMTGKDRQETIRQIKFDRPAGIGMTVAPAEKCVAIDLNVSIPEMQDIREFVLELKRQAAQKQPPKPKDPPKPFGAADH